MKNLRSATRTGLLVAACVLITAQAKAMPGYADGGIDVLMGFGTTLNASSPALADAGYGILLSTDTLGNVEPAGVGNLTWNATANNISLSGIQGNAASTGLSPHSGMFHNSAFGSNNGRVEYLSNTVSHTFGGVGALLPNATGKNNASFHSIYSAGDLGQDVTGVVGFRTSAGNWGYLEFDWDDTLETLTVLSARVQRFYGESITFNPPATSEGSLFTTVPEPVSGLLIALASVPLLLRRRTR